MASKQLGKLRQWAGEKISSREKTVVVEDELRELEQDIELRKQGIIRLQAASEVYHHVLSKKKDSPSSGEAEKLMPLDALGIVMVTHGEEYGNDSAYGTCLLALGRAHCKIATLQETYGLTFRDTFIASCEKFAQDVKDYEYQRKKLDSRRLSYDAAITKLEKLKNCKKEKEKERREAEDELQRCRLRFEETSEDVRARMQTIQENEILQLRELTGFLDIHLSFAKQYFDILNEVKDSWCDGASLTKFEDMRTDAQSHGFSSADDIKYTTIRSKRSTLSNHTSSVESEGDPGARGLVRRQSDAERSIIFSRPASRASRKRSDSVVTAGGNENGTKPNKRMSVTGWASSAVSSIAGRGKKDRDTFTALVNEGEEESSATPEVSRPPSSRSFSRKSPKAKPAELSVELTRSNGRILKPPSQQEKKHVRALYDFSGSSDELSFKAGDEITVIQEVLDDWWLGLHKDGRKGLFPTTYTEPISTTRRSSPFEPELDHTAIAHGDQMETSETDYTSPPHTANSLGFDTQSVASSVPDDEEERHLMPLKHSDEDIFLSPSRQFPPIPPPVLWNRTNSDTPKRPPPPPPRRRSTAPAIAPPIPDRRLQTEGMSSARVYMTLPDTSGQDVSPFDSLVDMSSRCVTFEQHPYEYKGLCKNCFRMH